jgi:ATP-dependent RNA helicase DDX46/PRP5
LRERKSHKTEDGDDDVVKDDDKEDDEAVKKAETAIRDATSAIQSRDAPKPEVAEPKPAVNEPVAKPSAAVPGKAVVGGGGAVDKAASAISAINARLGLRPGQTLDNKRPDAGAHSAILEINDFPQKARWAVTNRTNVAKILEMTGTSITTKGTFYPAGKSPGPGDDRKLCILIEGDTEVQVGNALAEMTRLLKEGTIAAADAEGRAPASGRYTVT